MGAGKRGKEIKGKVSQKFDEIVNNELMIISVTATSCLLACKRKEINDKVGESKSGEGAGSNLSMIVQILERFVFFPVTDCCGKN